MPLLETNNSTVNAETVMPLITDKSHVIIVNSPSNPIGSVFSYHDLTGLAKLTAEYNLTVISDEVYEKIEGALGRIEEAVKEFKHPVFPLPEDCLVLSTGFKLLVCCTA